MSEEYLLVCYTCESRMPDSLAGGAGAYGYKVWGVDDMLKWLGHGEPVGHHERHDLRIVHEQADLPWNCEDCGFRSLPREGEISCICEQDAERDVGR